MVIKRKITLLLLISLILTGCGYSAASPKPTSLPGFRAGWVSYTTDDGLKDNIVQTIVIAPDGAAWLSAHNGGITRFDGTHWKHYSKADGLTADTVLSGAVSPAGSLWFATIGGLARFDGKSWRQYNKRNRTMPSSCTSSIAIAQDNTLWAASCDYDGISYFDGKAWKTYTTADGLPANNFHEITVKPDGTVWACGIIDETGAPAPLAYFDGKSWSIDRTLEKYFILALAAAPDGTLWVGTSGGGLWHFDGHTWSNNYSSAGGIIEAIAVAPNGVVWVSSTGRDGHSWGASSFDGISWHTYTTADGLVGATVHSIAVAPDGAIWFGTSSGVSRYQP